MESLLEDQVSLVRFFRGHIPSQFSVLGYHRQMLYYGLSQCTFNFLTQSYCVGLHSMLHNLFS